MPLSLPATFVADVQNPIGSIFNNTSDVTATVNL